MILLVTLTVSFELFANAEVAFFSAFLIMLGSMYSYYRLVNKRLETFEAMNEQDVIDKIDDPYDLYDEKDESKPVSVEEIDIKAVIKEEKERLKAKSAKNMVSGAPAIVSLYRLIPYAFLIIGFIGLQNNGMLSLWPYLSGLGFGIIGGFFVGRALFTR